MKCPRCSGELRRSKKDPTYGLCDSCRKKYKWVEEELNDKSDDHHNEEINEMIDNDETDLPAKPKKQRPPSHRPKKKKRGPRIFLIILILLIAGSITAFILLGGLNKLNFNKNNTEQNTDLQQDDTNDQNDASTDTATTDDTQTENTEEYTSGTYLVGTAIPAGEYVLIADMAAYFERASDPSGELESISANGNFNTNTIVTINEGEYFIFKGSIAYPIDKAPALDTTQQGMFKVGRDIAAGEYTIRSEGEGSYKIASNSSHNLNSILSQEDFEGDKSITVSDGQYLMLIEASIVQQ